MGHAHTAAEPCMLDGVATRDSVSNYDTQAVAPLPKLPVDATVQERKEHLEEQLDRVTNKVIGGSLLVLAGEHNRLAGGALPPLSETHVVLERIACRLHTLANHVLLL